jgi:1,2-diacylglycerol 3-alpha-glucosyltransferase
MKICFLNPVDLDTAHALNFFYLGKELAKIGYDVTLLLPKIGEKLFIDDESDLIHIKRLKILIKPFFSQQLSYHYWIGGPVQIASNIIAGTFYSFFQHFDIIHSTKPLVQSAIPALVYSKFRKVLKLVHMDDYEGYGAILTGYMPIYSKFIKWYETTVLKYFDAVTCVSPFLSNVAKRFTLKKDIFIVPNGFDFKTFKNVKPVQSSNSEHLLLYVGGLRKNVDVDFIIRMMPLIIKQNQNVKLMIVGDGPRKGELIAMAKKLGVDDKIIFKGVQPNNLIPAFLSSADILLLPFRKNPFNEARFSNKIPEYMASGKPIVTNPVGVVDGIIKNRINGILVKPDNLELYAQAIIELMENNRLAKKIGKNAREYAMKNLTWKKIARKYDRIYNTLYHGR